jgi:hypothetical protein
MHDSVHANRLGRAPRTRLFAAACASAVLVAACGGSSHSPAVATVKSTTTSAPGTASAGTATTSHSSTTTDARSSTSTGADTAGSGPPSPAALESDALAFSKCMRADGVPDFPDPQPRGGFVLPAGAGLDPSSPLVKAARAKCLKLLPGGGPPGPGTQTHPSAPALAQMVKIAQCMRRHGISQFPDPRTSVPSNPFPRGGGGVISDIDGVILVFGATIDEQAPAFTRAAAACAFPLHNH